MSNKVLVAELNKVLADTFVLYFKTHSFHWNVTGPQFKSLHEMFMEQYTELWNATDEIAERIRILGEYAPNGWNAMVKNATLEESGQTPDAQTMLRMLVVDNRAIVESLTAAMKAAEEIDDQVSVDMMVQRITLHEKAAWMLESSL